MGASRNPTMGEQGPWRIPSVYLLPAGANCSPRLPLYRSKADPVLPAVASERRNPEWLLRGTIGT